MHVYQLPNNDSSDRHLIVRGRHKLTHTERQNSYDPVMCIIYMHLLPAHGYTKLVIRSSLYVKFKMSNYNGMLLVVHSQLANAPHPTTSHLNNITVPIINQHTTTHQEQNLQEIFPSTSLCIYACNVYQTACPTAASPVFKPATQPEPSIPSHLPKSCATNK
jgi:hypothetical protein